MNVVSPEPDPATVETLLATAWRLVDAEGARTEALDRKAATIATFASLVAALTATLGLGFVRTIDTWWSFAVFAVGLATLISSLGCAVRLLWPRAYATLGTAYVRRFPTWGEILKPATQVRGETLRTLVEIVALERGVNDRKIRWLRASLGLLVAGLVVIGIEGVILGVDEVHG